LEKTPVLVGDATEYLDAMYSIHRLREVGYWIDIAASTRREVKLVVHDLEEGGISWMATSSPALAVPSRVAARLRRGAGAGGGVPSQGTSAGRTVSRTVERPPLSVAYRAGNVSG